MSDAVDWASDIHRLGLRKSFDAEHGGKTLKELNSLLALMKGWTDNTFGNIIQTAWDIKHPSKRTPHGFFEVWRDLTTGQPRPPKK
jgi:hypothetical protein